MDKLSSLLPAALKRSGLHQPVMASLVVLKAQEWISANLSTHSNDLQAKTFVDGVLFIEAANAIALQECTLQAEELRRILTKIDGCVVKKVVVRR